MGYEQNANVFAYIVFRIMIKNLMIDVLQEEENI